HPVSAYLAADLGRSAHAMVSRFLRPLLVGVAFFDLYMPARWTTYPLFAVSILLAVLVSFGLRYAVNATAFWLLDIRGVQLTWSLAAGVLSGLYFPLRFLPGWLSTALWVGTPFPSILQTPLDVLVERESAVRLSGLVALQAGWAIIALAAAGLVQRAAERRMVIQGG
ncbi:MAG TPA: ABC-2 family transporter protein, partial [Micromonosporaceae bacterium]|nr:ABC-2 family transporter protein [Micromonosporaceae bacterium]